MCCLSRWIISKFDLHDFAVFFFREPKSSIDGERGSNNSSWYCDEDCQQFLVLTLRPKENVTRIKCKSWFFSFVIVVVDVNTVFLPVWIIWGIFLNSVFVMRVQSIKYKHTKEIFSDKVSQRIFLFKANPNTEIRLAACYYCQQRKSWYS